MGKFGIPKEMKDRLGALALLVCVAAVASASTACNSGQVGAPCTPEDEYSATFQGFSVDEVNVESASLQCESRLCLSNHFQGRVSCPYGQTKEQAENDPRCFIPGSREPVTRAVDPQLVTRRADESVYCSCRCDGPDTNARYCECPSGFSCKELVPKFGLHKQAQLVGSYCIKEGTDYDAIKAGLTTCDPLKQDCPE